MVAVPAASNGRGVVSEGAGFSVPVRVVSVGDKSGCGFFRSKHEFYTAFTNDNCTVGTFRAKNEV